MLITNSQTLLEPTIVGKSLIDQINEIAEERPVNPYERVFILSTSDGKHFCYSWAPTPILPNGAVMLCAFTSHEQATKAMNAYSIVGNISEVRLCEVMEISLTKPETQGVAIVFVEDKGSIVLLKPIWKHTYDSL